MLEPRPALREDASELARLNATGRAPGGKRRDRQAISLAAADWEAVNKSTAHSDLAPALLAVGLRTGALLGATSGRSRRFLHSLCAEPLGAAPRRTQTTRRHVLAAATLVAALLAACQSPAPPVAPLPSSPPLPPAAAPPAASIAALYQKPAERSLVEGIRLYEEASFERAEAAFRRSLRDGLGNPRDQAVAYKYVAFISCAFNRLAECEAGFASAFAADPEFALNEKEIGHPVWGPVYRRVAAAQAK